MGRERKESKREIKKKSTSGFFCVCQEKLEKTGGTGDGRTNSGFTAHRVACPSLSLTHALSLHTDCFILIKTEIPKRKRGRRADGSGLLSPTLQHIAPQPNGAVNGQRERKGRRPLK